MLRQSKVEVAIRVRPMRKELNEQRSAWEVHHTRITEKSNPDCTFQFERVYDTHFTTGEIYEKSVKDAIVKPVTQGYNGTVFAYGQTGSGKSFTMLGDGLGGHNEGVTSMAVNDLFAGLEKERAKGMEVKVFVAMLEIYNEQLRDLLIPENTPAPPLAIRENEHGVYVHNAVRRAVTSPRQCLEAIHNEAEKRRVSAATSMNEHSSRSHCLIRILVEKTMTFEASSDSSAGEGEDEDETSLKKKIVSSLNLVDLAGSERVSKTGATGIRMVEGGHINKSLTILTTVINRLTEAKSANTYIPYRDSKLTHMLKTAIGGNSFTTVFCCMTAADLHVDESRSTLQFATRAKTIKNAVSLNEVADNRTKIRELELEIKKYRQMIIATNIYIWSKDLKIKHLKEQGPGASSSEVEQMSALIETLTAQNSELQESLREAKEQAGHVHLDPMMNLIDSEKTALQSENNELKQRITELEQDNKDLKTTCDETEELIDELEAENDKIEAQLNELSKKHRNTETMLQTTQQSEKLLQNQVAQLQERRKIDDLRMLEQVRGDELLEKLTQVEIDYATLQVEHETLMDMHARLEIEKSAENAVLRETIDELLESKEEMHVAEANHNAALWRFIGVAAMAAGKPLDSSKATGSVRDYQIEQAIRDLSGFIASRQAKPPSTAPPAEQTKPVAPPAPSSTLPPMTQKTSEEMKAMTEKIKDLEAQIHLKDAQRDTIIDAKLKRIQDLVVRLHFANGTLVEEIQRIVTTNNQLHQMISKSNKLAGQLKEADIHPESLANILNRANFGAVPTPPWGHN